MNETNRSKSFKALSTAQPIRKQIQVTLNKLELEKRRYLAVDRQETLLKQQVERKRKQLNSLKLQVPAIQTDQKKATQTTQKFRNTDRTFQLTLNNIQKLKLEIDEHRRQVFKYKDVQKGLVQDTEKLNKEIEKMILEIENKQVENQQVKNQIVNYREMNIKNLQEFRKSHTHLNKSNIRDENERKKYGVTTKTFLGQEMKNSKMVHFQLLSQPLRNSGINTNEGKVDIMSGSVPLAKQRVNFIIHKNKQKIKIAEDYMKFGQGLEGLFNVMKQYKGRDDVDYLAEQFVAKEKQIQKLGQYVGKLQYRIETSNRKVNKKLKEDENLQKQLTQQSGNQVDKQYKQLNDKTEAQIQQLKKDHLLMNAWLKKVGNILCPLADDQDFSRGNAANVIGRIQEKLNINKINDKKTANMAKQIPLPALEEQNFQKHGELLNYEKMKQFAQQFIRNKKNPQ